MPADPSQFATALAQYAAGVCLLTVQDGIDDVGTTVSSVMSVSAAPPLMAVGLTAGGSPRRAARGGRPLRAPGPRRGARDRRLPVLLGRPAQRPAPAGIGPLE